MPSTMFAIGAAGEPVAHQLPGEEGASANGHRVGAGELAGLIDTLLDPLAFAHVAAHDDSSSRQV